jgi:hypothetical protein
MDRPEGNQSAGLEHRAVYRLDRHCSRQARVFCMFDGRPLDSSYVRLLFHRLGRVADITKQVYPHGLRHPGNGGGDGVLNIDDLVR